jgi:hypothetical protein
MRASKEAELSFLTLEEIDQLKQARDILDKVYYNRNSIVLFSPEKKCCTML